MKNMLKPEEIAVKVDKLAKIKRLQTKLKAISETLEAELLKQFEVDVENTKYHTVK